MIRQAIHHFHPLNRLARKRDRFIGRSPMPELLLPLLNTPKVTSNTRLSEVEFLVLDMETTGLDSDEDLILSIGWVVVANGYVDLAKSQHFYINEKSQVKPETAVINHITPQMLSHGVPLHDAMATLFKAARNRVLVAHGCMIESQFIEGYLKHNFSLSSLPLLWIDTLIIEKNLAKAVNRHQELEMELSATRMRYHLPEYITHTALTDAAATAELLLAQCKRLKNKDLPSLGLLYKLSQS